jgi:hypothetical protein
MKQQDQADKLNRVRMAANFNTCITVEKHQWEIGDRLGLIIVSPTGEPLAAYKQVPLMENVRLYCAPLRGELMENSDVIVVDDEEDENVILLDD